MSEVARDPLYRRHRYPAEIIAHAVWLYFRFPLSLRMVEDMLASRGIIVTHQTIRSWAEKFGRHFAREIKRRSAGCLGDKWHLDECVVAINGKKQWLWRAVDQDGFVLEVRSCRGAPSRRSATASIIWKVLVPELGADIEAHSSSSGPLPISDRSPPPPDGGCLPLTTLRALSKTDGGRQAESRRCHRHCPRNGSIPVGDWTGGRSHGKRLNADGQLGQRRLIQKLKSSAVG